jgi:hypothetical protein
MSRLLLSRDFEGAYGRAGIGEAVLRALQNNVQAAKRELLRERLEAREAKAVAERERREAVGPPPAPPSVCLSGFLVPACLSVCLSGSFVCWLHGQKGAGLKRSLFDH